jgi:Mrp family chromosome partitioning ATPase
MNRADMAFSDQAKELRRIVELHRQETRISGNMRTLAVLSGKGGVGKSNLSLNLACALADRTEESSFWMRISDWPISICSAASPPNTTLLT